jgi:uncharacterized OB-fold protein
MSVPASPQMTRLLDAIGQFGFAVPHCNVCDRVHYPPQSWCPYCLSTRIEFRPDSARARVLSTVTLHRSVEAEWESRLPCHVACVVTDSGLKVFALADLDLPADTAVILELHSGLLRIRVVE